MENKMGNQADILRNKLQCGTKELEENLELQMKLCTQIDKLKQKKNHLAKNLEDDQRILSYLSKLCHNEIEQEENTKEDDEQEIIEYITQLENELQSLNAIKAKMVSRRYSKDN